MKKKKFRHHCNMCPSFLTISNVPIDFFVFWSIENADDMEKIKLFGPATATATNNATALYFLFNYCHFRVDQLIWKSFIWNSWWLQFVYERPQVNRAEHPHIHFIASIKIEFKWLIVWKWIGPCNFRDFFLSLLASHQFYCHYNKNAIHFDVPSG